MTDLLVTQYVEVPCMRCGAEVFCRFDGKDQIGFFDAANDAAAPHGCDLGASLARRRSPSNKRSRLPCLPNEAYESNRNSGDESEPPFLDLGSDPEPPMLF